MSPRATRENERPRVLVADDNADMRHYLARLLSRRFEVEAVADGEAALAAVRARRPGLILSDVMMPRMDGFELVRTLRGDETTRTIPIILLSARAGEESRVEGLDVGADDYLVKPFSARELLARVESHLTLSRLRELSEQRMTQLLGTFQHLVENSPFGVFAVDADFRLAEISAGARKTFGEAQPLIGRDFDELLRTIWPEPFVSEALAHFRHTLATGEPYHSSHTVEQRLDRGAVESYDWRLDRLTLPDGRHGVVCHFYDLSERQRYEGAIRESEARFRLLAESLPQFVWECDARGVLLFVNQRWMDYAGVTLEQTGDTSRLANDFHPDDAARVADHWAEALATARPMQVEARLRRHDGEFRWFLIRAEPLMQDGRAVRWFGTSTDITEHKLAAEAERHFFTLTNALLIEATFDGWLRRVNPAWEVLLGWTAAELTSRPFIHFVHPDDRVATEAALQRLVRDSAPVTDFENRYRCRDGSYRWIRWNTSAAPERGAIYGVAQDVTEQVRAQEALRRSAEEALAANRAKDTFLAALSHELRTPLTPVLMGAAALREDPRLPDDVRDELGMIERNIALEARLIDDLLDLTRIAKGKLELRQQPCDAHSLIGLAIEIVRDDAQAKGITLQSDLQAERSGVSADPARFQQVIWNLLRNSVRFTPSGGRITIRTRDAADAHGAPMLRIEVTDTGVGIEAAALERIFAPFEQAATSGGHRFGGLGLGLAIARAIVDLHGGNIFAQSPGLGAGATFIVEFTAPTRPEPGVFSNSSQPHPSIGAPEAPLHLLLVEDHEPTLQVLSRLLARAGHQLTTAKNVAEALVAAAAERPDLVISDLGLPDGTGIELMSKLRAAYGLKGIALSGYDMEEDLARSRGAGFIAHLIKPVDFDQLRRAVRDAAPQVQ